MGYKYYAACLTYALKLETSSLQLFTLLELEMNPFVGKTIDYVERLFKNEYSWHDRRHIRRVMQLATSIAKKEWGDLTVVQLWALLHDIADAKFHNGDTSAWPIAARIRLQSIHCPPEITEHVAQIVASISFKGRSNVTTLPSLEAQIVQDADRLDGIGAIGIARVFSFGGSQNRLIHDPQWIPDPDSYEIVNWSKTSISHFYERMLFHKELMNTRTGKSLAEKRHIFLETFLKQFWEERSGEK